MKVISMERSIFQKVKGGGDSESELNAATNSEDQVNDNISTGACVAYLRKSRNIIDSWICRNKPFKKTKRTLRNICIRVPEIIGSAKNLTDILDRLKCLITDPESIVQDTNKYICSVSISVQPNYIHQGTLEI